MSFIVKLSHTLLFHYFDTDIKEKLLPEYSETGQRILRVDHKDGLNLAGNVHNDIGRTPCP